MKNKKSFIFLTAEGTTFCPSNENGQEEVENLQVVGWADGTDAEDSFEHLVEESGYLLETGFEEIIALELAGDVQGNRNYFYLSDYKNRRSNTSK